MHQNLHMAPLHLYRIAPREEDELSSPTLQGRGQERVETDEECPGSLICTLRIPSTARNEHCTPRTMHPTPGTSHCARHTMCCNIARCSTAHGSLHCTHRLLWSHVLTISMLCKTYLKGYNCVFHRRFTTFNHFTSQM